MNDLITIGDLSRSLGVSYAKAKGLVSDMIPALKTGNGRVVLYSQQEVKQQLAASNENLLKFLGYRPLDESYDVVTTD